MRERAREKLIEREKRERPSVDTRLRPRSRRRREINKERKVREDEIN